MTVALALAITALHGHEGIEHNLIRRQWYSF
jgi:hypothetical protein